MCWYILFFFKDLNIPCTVNGENWVVCSGICGDLNALVVLGLQIEAAKEISSADCAGGVCHCYYNVGV